MSEPNFLLREVVEFLHDQGIEHYGGSRGILDQNMLESAIQRAPNRYFYGGPHTDLFDLGAAYAFSLAKNHAFCDGNKRTAWASCILFLLDHGIRVTATIQESVDIIVDLAEGKISEDEFSIWLRARAVPS